VISYVYSIASPAFCIMKRRSGKHSY